MILVLLWVMSAHSASIALCFRAVRPLAQVFQAAVYECPGTIPEFPVRSANCPPWANAEFILVWRPFRSAHTPSFGSAQALPTGSLLHDRGYEPPILYPPGLYEVTRLLYQPTSRTVVAGCGLAQAPLRGTVSSYSARALPERPTKAMCECNLSYINPDWQSESLAVVAGTRIAQASPPATVSYCAPRALPARPVKTLCSCKFSFIDPDRPHKSHVDLVRSDSVTLLASPGPSPTSRHNV